MFYWALAFELSEVTFSSGAVANEKSVFVS